MMPPFTESIQAAELSHHVDALLALVEKSNQHVIIRRNQKRVARLVPEIYVQVIDQLIETDPTFADTVALMLNEEARSAVQASMREWKAGNVRPAQKVFDEVRADSRQNIR